MTRRAARCRGDVPGTSVARACPAGIAGDPLPGGNAPRDRVLRGDGLGDGQGRRARLSFEVHSQAPHLHFALAERRNRPGWSPGAPGVAFGCNIDRMTLRRALLALSLVAIAAPAAASPPVRDSRSPRDGTTCNTRPGVRIVRGGRAARRSHRDRVRGQHRSRRRRCGRSEAVEVCHRFRPCRRRARQEPHARSRQAETSGRLDRRAADQGAAAGQVRRSRSRGRTRDADDDRDGRPVRDHRKDRQDTGGVRQGAARGPTSRRTSGRRSRRTKDRKIRRPRKTRNRRRPSPSPNQPHQPRTQRRERSSKPAGKGGFWKKFYGKVVGDPQS